MVRLWEEPGPAELQQLCLSLVQFKKRGTGKIAQGREELCRHLLEGHLLEVGVWWSPCLCPQPLWVVLPRGLASLWVLGALARRDSAQQVSSLPPSLGTGLWPPGRMWFLTPVPGTREGSCHQ